MLIPMKDPVSAGQVKEGSEMSVADRQLQISESRGLRVGSACQELMMHSHSCLESPTAPAYKGRPGRLPLSTWLMIKLSRGTS